MLLFCMFSCTQERRERHMVSFIVKDLERYPMGKNSYLIVNSKDLPIWYNRIKGSYWVGPFYEDLIQSPLGFSFSSGNVYKIAASENVYMFDKHMKSKDTISICYAVRDSVPIVNSEMLVIRCLSIKLHLLIIPKEQGCIKDIEIVFGLIINPIRL